MHQFYEAKIGKLMGGALLNNAAQNMPAEIETATHTIPERNKTTAVIGMLPSKNFLGSRPKLVDTDTITNSESTLAMTEMVKKSAEIKYII